MTPHHLLTDAELAALLKAGDHAAFAEIYDRFFSVLYVHAFNRLRDEDEAKDVVQELFTTMWAKHESAVFTNLSNYLYTSVRNRIINAVAHKAVATKYIEALPQSVIIEVCITDYKVRERQLAAIIAREIATLPPKMREVFEMSRRNNLSHKEIADHLGITEQSVRSHIKNALKILRVRLGFALYLMFLFTR